MKRTYHLYRFRFVSHVLVFVSLAVLSSCKKDPVKEPVYYDSKLSIYFDNTTINPALADSVYAFFQKSNSNQPIMKRLQLVQGKWETATSDLSAGEWTVTLNFYARSAEANDYANRLFTQIKTFTVSGNTDNSFTIKAPKGKFDDTWKTNLLLVDSPNNVSVVLSANGTDPYLEVRTPAKDEYYFYIERNAYQAGSGSSQLIAAHAWECSDGCYTSNSPWIVNNTHFLPYAQQIQNKEWNVGEVFIIITNTRTNKESTFYYLYKKSWFL